MPVLSGKYIAPQMSNAIIVKSQSSLWGECLSFKFCFDCQQRYKRMGEKDVDTTLRTTFLQEYKENCSTWLFLKTQVVWLSALWKPFFTGTLCIKFCRKYLILPYYGGLCTCH